MAVPLPIDQIARGSGTAKTKGRERGTYLNVSIFGFPRVRYGRAGEMNKESETI